MSQARPHRGSPLRPPGTVQTPQASQLGGGRATSRWWAEAKGATHVRWSPGRPPRPADGRSWPACHGGRSSPGGPCLWGGPRRLPPALRPPCPSLKWSTPRDAVGCRPPTAGSRRAGPIWKADPAWPPQDAHGRREGSGPGGQLAVGLGAREGGSSGPWGLMLSLLHCFNDSP